MAQHAPLVNFLSRLNTDVGAGTDKEFLTTTGRRLAAAQILPEEDFGKQGQPSSSELGALLRILHSVGGDVDWDNVITTGHGNAVNFFAAVGIDLSDQVRRVLLSRGHARGSGTHHAEVETGQMPSYKECQLAISAADWAVFCNCMQTRNIIGAHNLMASGSDFAKILRHSSLFAGTTITKKVP